MKKLLLILFCLPLLFGCGREAKTIETDKEKKERRDKLRKEKNKNSSGKNKIKNKKK